MKIKPRNARMKNTSWYRTAQPAGQCMAREAPTYFCKLSEKWVGYFKISSRDMIFVYGKQTRFKPTGRKM